MRRLKSLLMILAALWLPVQAVAAVKTPFCRHAVNEQAAVAHLAQATAAPCHVHSDAKPQKTAPAVDCDQCEICHLATAGYLPARFALEWPENPVALIATPLPALSGDFPETLLRPPSTAA